MWRLDTFWLSMRDQTPWVDRYPSEYLPGHVRFCSSAFDGPVGEGLEKGMQRWMDFTGKSDLLMYGSNYPHWSTSEPDLTAAGLGDEQRDKVLWRNASELYGLAVKESLK
jgi:predicted TIM-barrel fold metal-dependent hydrolase